MAESKTNYLVFLLVTLSRFDFELKELASFFEKTDLDKSVARLREHNLIHLNNSKLSVNLVERIFPKPINVDMKKQYKSFDAWDTEIGNLFHFTEITNRKFVRRVSGRYISLIEKHLQIVFELIRTADEIDPKHNDKVVQFQLNFQSGELPG